MTRASARRKRWGNFLSYENSERRLPRFNPGNTDGGDYLPDTFDRNPMLRPWNVGEFAGKPRSKYQAELHKHIVDPDMPIKDGESLNEFRARWQSTLDEYIAQASDSAFP